MLNHRNVISGEVIEHVKKVANDEYEVAYKAIRKVRTLFILRKQY